MAVDQKYLYDDVVCRINKSGNIQFGMVLQNSELLYTYDSSDEEEDYGMKKGHIQVLWVKTGEEEVIREKKVCLADRPMLPGDVVRRKSKDKDTQHGCCRDINVTACVQVIGTKNIITDLNAQKLIPLKDFIPGIPVCVDHWVGEIKKVKSLMTLQTSDGSRCVIKVRDFLSDFDTYSDNDYTFNDGYYPGQTIWGPVCGLDQATWLRCTKKLMHMLGGKSSQKIKVKIEGVETKSVDVRWRSEAFSKGEKDRPDKTVSGEALKRLKILNMDELSILRLGDRSYYTLEEGDLVTTKGKWRREQIQARALARDCRDRRSTVKPARAKSSGDKTTQTRKLSEDKPSPEPSEHKTSPSPSSEVDTATYDEDIPSEKGTCSKKTKSTGNNCRGRKGAKKGSAAPTKANGQVTLKTKSFLGEKKLLRTREKRPPVQWGERFPVETVNTVSRATVAWQDGTVESVLTTELYPVTSGDREYFPGDFVVEARVNGASDVYGVVQSSDLAGRTSVVQWYRAYTSGDPRPSPLEREEVSVYDIKAHPDFLHQHGAVVIRVANFEGEDSKCWVGHVLEASAGGEVSVQWVDGDTSQCWPQDIFVLRTNSRLRLLSSDVEEYECDDISDSSWDTDTDEEADEGKANEEVTLDEARVSSEKISEAPQGCDSEKRIVPESYHSHVFNICAFLLGRMVKACTYVMRWFFGLTMLPNTTPTDGVDPVFSVSGQLEANNEPKETAGGLIKAGLSLSEPSGPEPAKECSGEFSMMDTAPDGHKFKAKKFQPTDPKTFFKTVQNEIKLLRTSLPGGIWAKGFEDRLDLFSVMIRGPSKTPYEDGLFLFDVQLPSDYPKSPPSFHYVSFCDDRLNPNLYECGKVCVSLLGTWSGKGSEVWTASSNLLQVIVSIQGLILVSEPYFNEPGYERERGTPQGRDNSQAYNETAVLRMVQGLSEMVMRAPSVFEVEILVHFAVNSDRLCGRLEAWMELSERRDGPPAETEERQDVGDGARLPDFPLIPASKGFCLTLRKALKTFREVLESIGITPSLN